MTDFVNIRRSLKSEKERIDRLDKIMGQKLSEMENELSNALSAVDEAEIKLNDLENQIKTLKRQELDYENKKAELERKIESLEENIDRLKRSINDENNKIETLKADINDLQVKINQKEQQLTNTKQIIEETKNNIDTKRQEKTGLKMQNEQEIAEAQKELEKLKKEEQKDIQVSPILDFLLKEVRIDIPEVEILSALAYHNKAIGIEDLKKAVKNTPPVIVLKAIRNLDSKGIIKYDERLDTIEITAPLV
ncbi:MAG: hypothetical protein U9O98_04365 [Asgard group archaeon]|nr:hypothetical protein [Asgard group archaeon]